ncbi:MAG: SIS domain-containing protein [Phycisphaerae bacterium]
MIEKIRENIREHLGVIEKMCCDETLTVLEKIAGGIVRSVENGGKVVLAGNGGSAADAQHIAGEFIGRYLFDRRPLPAISLSTDSSVLTCVGNDYSYDDIFLRQVRALVKTGDVFWGLTTSGNSRNIILAGQAAKELGAVVVGFTGESGGKFKGICDFCFCSPHTRANRIQEGHMLAYHVVCELMEARLCLKK